MKKILEYSKNWNFMESKIINHYKIQNKIQYEPPNKDYLQNKFKKNYIFQIS